MALMPPERRSSAPLNSRLVPEQAHALLAFVPGSVQMAFNKAAEPILHLEGILSFIKTVISGEVQHGPMATVGRASVVRREWLIVVVGG